MDRIIRQAEQDDHEALVACVQAAYAKYIERIGKKPAPMLADYKALIAQRVVYVLADEEGVRGVLVMMPEDRGMYVENVAVDPHCQGQGLGRALMAFVEQQARKEQLGEIRLYTNEVMTENLLFYHQLGFEKEGRQMQNGYRRIASRGKDGDEGELLDFLMSLPSHQAHPSPKSTESQTHVESAERALCQNVLPVCAIS